MTTNPALLAFRRAQLEAKIEELIALLDTLDDDPDLEDTGDDEPSFGHARSIKGKLQYELEDDPAESGIADQDALTLTMQQEDWSGMISCDGSGKAIARQMLRYRRRAVKQTA